MSQKTLLLAEDLCCHGKCSLSVALPIISALGVSASLLPTELLSAHTGGFGSPIRLDQADFCRDCLGHFEKENITFDGVLCGYCSDPRLITDLADLLPKRVKTQGFLAVDPAFADQGKLFAGVPKEIPFAMSKLCRVANVILPNVTEACVLCGRPYREYFCREEVEDLAKKLFDRFGALSVVTGAVTAETIGACAFDGCEIMWAETPYVDGHFHGTGDIFTAVFAGEYVKTRDARKALSKAADFVYACIQEKKKDTTLEREGLPFERKLSLLH